VVGRRLLLVTRRPEGDGQVDQSGRARKNRPPTYAIASVDHALLLATSLQVEGPLTVSEAEAAVSSWLAQPAAGILEPGERHWDILRGLVRDGQTTGALVMDAVLAAIAIEHGATVCTTDRDFSRFSGLKWTNPLVASSK